MSFLLPEPSRHDLTFTLRGIPVRVTPWFWLVQGVLGALATAPFLLITTHHRGPGGAYLALFVLPAWLLCAFVSVLVHELGHVVAGAWLGARGEVVLTGLGGLALGSAATPLRALSFPMGVAAGIGRRPSDEGSPPSCLPKFPAAFWQATFSSQVIVRGALAPPDPSCLP
jgi:hypothetical protein